MRTAFVFMSLVLWHPARAKTSFMCEQLSSMSMPSAIPIFSFSNLFSELNFHPEHGRKTLLLRLNGGKGRVPGKGMKRRKRGKLNAPLFEEDSEDENKEQSESSSDGEIIPGSKDAPVLKDFGLVADEIKQPKGSVRLLRRARPRDDRFDLSAYQAEDTKKYEDDMVVVEHMSDSDMDSRSRKDNHARSGRLNEEIAVANSKQEILSKSRHPAKTKKTEQEWRKIDEVGSAGFGMKPSDYADGGAFSETVGTKFVEDNRFFLPEDAVRSILQDGDPLARLNQKEAERKNARAAMLAERAERKAERAERRRREQQVPGVLYVGRIPAGFYEEAQYQFFSQFGTVTRLRLARSRRTSGYKGYGFVEFGDVEHAREAARVRPAAQRERKEGREKGREGGREGGWVGGWVGGCVGGRRELRKERRQWLLSCVGQAITYTH